MAKESIFRDGKRKTVSKKKKAKKASTRVEAKRLRKAKLRAITEAKYDAWLKYSRSRTVATLEEVEPHHETVDTPTCVLEVVNMNLTAEAISKRRKMPDNESALATFLQNLWG